MTFHETASYDDVSDIPAGVSHTNWREEELNNIRWNTLKVLRQLSHCGLKEDEYKIMEMTAVRRPLMKVRHGETAMPESDHPIEGSSNLFYYLFEDYSAAVSILNSSKKALEQLVSSSALALLRYRILIPHFQSHTVLETSRTVSPLMMRP